MKIRTLLVAGMLAGLVAASGLAHAIGDELIRVEHCRSTHIPQERAECEQRQKALAQAYRRERQKKRLEDARAEKNSSLCFTRKATLEVVCPN